MAKRNRRRSRSFLIPAPLVGLFVLAASLALIYLWMDHVCGAFGQRIRELERENTSLGNDLLRERHNWTAMRSPANLERALLRHGIAMGLPRPEQVVRINTVAEREDIGRVSTEHWAFLERER